MCLCPQRLAREALTLAQERSQGQWVSPGAEHGERTLWEPGWPLCRGRDAREPAAPGDWAEGWLWGVRPPWGGRGCGRPTSFPPPLMAGVRDEVARQVRAVSPGVWSILHLAPCRPTPGLAPGALPPQSQSRSGRAFMSRGSVGLQREPPSLLCGWTSPPTCTTTQPGSPTSEQVCKPEGEAACSPVLSLQIGKKLRDWHSRQRLQLSGGCVPACSRKDKPCSDLTAQRSSLIMKAIFPDSHLASPRRLGGESKGQILLTSDSSQRMPGALALSAAEQTLSWSTHLKSLLQNSVSGREAAQEPRAGRWSPSGVPLMGRGLRNPRAEEGHGRDGL